jgi:hypothetical protein
MTPHEVADLVGCSTSHVRNSIRANKLEARLVIDELGYHWFIEPAEARRFAALRPREGWKRGRPRRKT